MKNIVSLDLNLLKVFDALLRERSVTRAAAAVGLSQPAASHALARLRELFSDELFVRLPHGMEPTPRALELGELVVGALGQVRRALDLSQGFDAVTTTRQFAVGMVEHAQIALAPLLSEHFAQQAPNASLQVLPIDFTNLLDRLDGNRVTMALGNLREPTPQYRRQLVYQDSMAVLARRDDALAERPLTAEGYATARHLLVTPAGRTPGNIDSVLLGRNLKRRVVLTLASYLAVPQALSRAHLLVSLPRMVGEYLAQLDSNLVVLDLPFERPVDLNLFWHPRHDGDPAERWLRQTLVDIGRRIDPRLRLALRDAS
jgi:DNA-binding transcriptional LysR family regulator